MDLAEAYQEIPAQHTATETFGGILTHGLAALSSLTSQDAMLLRILLSLAFGICQILQISINI